MAEIDAAAITQWGIPRLLLMEHAGLALAHAVRALSPQAAGPIAVCCGGGFNGGDGLSAARHLHAWGYRLAVILIGRMSSLRKEPALYARMVRRLGLEITGCVSLNDVGKLAPLLGGCSAVLDALLGIGARGHVREPMASMIRMMNASGLPIVAADVPSGLHADTGEVQGTCVKASVTVTFGLPKHGLFLKEGPAHAGSVIVDPITIPRELLDGALA